MRLLALLLLLPLPASAWDFTPLPICTIDHAAEGIDVQVTFDPASGIYALRLDRSEGWPEARVFTLRFDVGMGLTISTDRHRIDGTQLEVTDRGFGNVLNGLEFNGRAVLLFDGTPLTAFDLDGAPPAVRAFRDCPAVPNA
jgi:hypothetical protein